MDDNFATLVLALRQGKFCSVLLFLVLSCWFVIVIYLYSILRCVVCMCVCVRYRHISLFCHALYVCVLCF